MTAGRGEHTLTEEVYRVIRSELLSGAYKPGAPLRVPALRERFSVSMSVIREALIRLSEQGLLTALPKQGFRVRALSLEDLEDLTNLRILVETRALETSIERGDSRWEGDVLSAHHVLQSTPPSEGVATGTSPEWDAAHATFHDTLVAACGSPRLIEFTRKLRDSAEVYRQLAASASSYEERGVALEHRNLMDATLARDTEAAVALLSGHLQKTCDAVVAGGGLGS
ncbi:MAG: GntR family transcriptional regulator [Microbacterium ginsengisoli]|nr:GntR family transcriptional regulator [Microbacterium ginsengisoli]